MSSDALGARSARQQETTVYRVIFHNVNEPAGTLRAAWFHSRQDAQAFVDSIGEEAQVYGLNTEWAPSDPEELVGWLNRMSEVSPLSY